MKKLLITLLALVMCLSLCACSEPDSQETDPTKATKPTATEPTNATEPTDETDPTDDTDATTEPTLETEPTVAPTQPTVAPTDPTVAPTDPVVTPTEPTNLPTVPPTVPVDPTKVLEEFVNGWWTTKVANAAVDEYGDTLTSIYLDTSEASEYGYMVYFANNPNGEQVYDQVIHDGKTYLNISFSGSMGGFRFDVLSNGNVELEMMNGTIFELARVSAEEYKVASTNNATFLPVGTVFVDQYKLDIG